MSISRHNVTSVFVVVNVCLAVAHFSASRNALEICQSEFLEDFLTDCSSMISASWIPSPAFAFFVAMFVSKAALIALEFFGIYFGNKWAIFWGEAKCGRLRYASKWERCSSTPTHSILTGLQPTHFKITGQKERVGVENFIFQILTRSGASRLYFRLENFKKF